MDSNAATEFLDAITSLHCTSLLSDVQIKLKDRTVPAHRLVLYARGGTWSSGQLSDISCLDWSHLDPEIAIALLKWTYTTKLNESTDQDSLLALMRAASEVQLPRLVFQCEDQLISQTTIQNCIRMYAEATNAKAKALLTRAGQVISESWNLLPSSAFEKLEADLVCELIANNSRYPLHRVVKLARQDVVETFLESNKDDIPRWINQPDQDGCLPLELALGEQLTEMAHLLCNINADVNARDASGWSLLQRAIRSCDDYAAEFLIKQNADVFCVTPQSQDTCLHLVCGRISCMPSGPFASSEDSEDGEGSDQFRMAHIGRLLLKKGVDPSKQNESGFTPLHMAVMERNMPMLRMMLEQKSTNVNAVTKDGMPALWYALKNIASRPTAEILLNAGARADMVITDDRQSLIQLLISLGQEGEALYISQYIPESQLNHMTTCGETALHLAAMMGMKDLVARLLDLGANVNIETIAPPSRTTQHDGGTSVTYTGYKQTCLHYAILHGQIEVVEVLLSKGDSNLDCNLKDSIGNTPLSLALTYRSPELLTIVFPKLINAGADINLRNGTGLTLLHEAILNCDCETSIFLLDHGADINALTKSESQHPLQMAIENRLPAVVKALCKRGVDMSMPNKDGHCPLWATLVSGQKDVASILVRNGADTDAWGPGPGGCYQTLLHAALDISEEDIAKFLITNGCDYISPRRPSPDGEGGEEARDGCTPLHISCQWGLTDVVFTILEYGNGAINKQDSEGRTPLHIAIENGHDLIINALLGHPSVDMLIQDERGLSPFGIALKMKNHSAARAILDRHPNAAEQFNNKSYNFLHSALIANHVENALFLLSLNLDVNSRTRDGSESTPLHLAAARGNEVIVRTIILAGASPDCVDKNQQTPLHIAATEGHASVIPALLQNDASITSRDVDGNTPLHNACKEGHLSAVRMLLSEVPPEGDFLNLKRQNPLHILARFGKENSAAIFNCLVEIYPFFPLDKPDIDGNTALLFAYMKGNGNLCRELVRAGASLGCLNKDGVTMFNYQVATNTKQLLYNLLECLDKEPPWSEGDSCLECGTKFSLKIRRHHCRHCGRLLCARCSDQDVAIIKFKLNKPVRVCAVCYLVLQGGTS